MIRSRFVCRCAGIVAASAVFNGCDLWPGQQSRVPRPAKEEAVLATMEQLRPLPGKALPDDVPLYPNLRGTDVTRLGPELVGDRFESVVNVMGSSRYSREAVMEFYRTELPKKGYEAGPVDVNEKAIAQEFTKGRLKVTVGAVASTYAKSYPTTVVLSVTTAKAEESDGTATGPNEKDNHA